MKIRSIQLENFRQFFGTHSIEFSVHDSKNITVIHGENGGGKTGILNAFKWVLYEETDLDTGDTKLLNTRAFVECEEQEKINLSVKITFEHNEREYEATRTQTFIRNGDEEQKVGSAQLKLTWTDPQNGFDSASNPDVHLKRILPHNLHTYFFFHGERIEKLASVQGSDKVKDAIKNLMGIEVIERAHKHLDNGVKQTLKAEQKKYASAKDAEILEEIDKIEKAISNLENENKNSKDTIKNARIDIELIDEKLRDFKQIEELQKKRNEKEEHIATYKEDLAQYSKQNRQLISSKGFQAFFQNSAEEVTNDLEVRRKKGELPYKVKRQFIDDLLQQEECICGSDLSEGTDFRKKILEFMEKVGAADLEEGFMVTTSALSNFHEEALELKSSLINNLKGASERRARIKKLDEELDAISDKINDSGLEEVTALEAKRKELDALISQSDRKIGENDGQLKPLRSRKSELEKTYSEEASKSEKARYVARQNELANAAKDGLTNVIAALSNDIRQTLSERVKSTVNSILRNEYIAEIDNNYTLKFFQDTPRGRIEVPDLSSGQKVVASLSFIASIINIAKQRFHSEGAHDYFTGGLYPLVMDTPFGNADDDHSVNIARFIPNLADQVIILVSNKNWSDQVDEICKQKIGKEYSLIHYSPNPKENVDDRYERKSETGYEYSELEEGYYGRESQKAIAV